MHEYTSTHKLFREIMSIKRAQWTMIWLTLSSVALIISLASYGATVVNEQMNTISLSVAAQIYNHAQLEQRIITELAAKQNGEFHYPLIIRSSNVMIHVNTFAYTPSFIAADVEYYSACPASARYATYLNKLYNLLRPPVISNVFLFAGSHGLGKSYASFQLGKALSRFANTVVFSVPMNTFNNINDAGALIERVEKALGKTSFIVWSFDELDSYVLNNRNDMRDKTITQFAEYTGFVKNANRVLVFTMNNAEVLLHDYWADRKRIETDFLHYEHANDFNKAIEFTGLERRTFLQEGQLSRLHSFVGNKLFVYEPFDANAARTFAVRYLNRANAQQATAAVETLLGGNSSRRFSIRTLKIALDDIVNNV
ncbi:hypothetical protein [Epiphyas postvittana nucleopolyhedrovirus]|uniref:Uncharacterized protein n=1 Tax=Epiphyas postvittana nucleopolyhedrovirus TaxID=70600 RepID=Q91GF5_NPVEP|nr:hypothetical protein [Epiphyas postvittana nucleopolyhedrovirus]AAK85663.1 unknown [Epiphyas postvittana nucleopolyhedrovirus]